MTNEIIKFFSDNFYSANGLWITIGGAKFNIINDFVSIILISFLSAFLIVSIWEVMTKQQKEITSD